MIRLGTLVALLVTLLAAPAQADRRERLPPRAISSDSVVDAYGVGVHTHFLDTPYRDTAAVAKALRRLGVRHVRDDLHLDAPRQYAAIGQVARAGVRFNLIMGRPGGEATPADYVDIAASQIPAGAVESLEGVNEWDLFGGGEEWPTEAADWQSSLAAAARTNPATARLPLLSPSLAFRWHYPRLGDLSPWADVANAHVYPGAYPPGTEINRTVDALRWSVPSGPVVVTEAGYHNAINDDGAFQGVPEAVSGIYLPRLLLEHVARGHQRVYSYELIDEFDDPARTNREANFGLLRHDWSPKPAYLAMQRLIRLLADRRTDRPFRPGRLRITASGLPADARHLLTQRRNGKFVLLLWRDRSVYDPERKVRVPVPRQRVTLRLGRERRVAVFRPSLQGKPVRRDRARRVQVRVGADVTAVVIGRPVARKPAKG